MFFLVRCLVHGSGAFTSFISPELVTILQSFGEAIAYFIMWFSYIKK